MEHSVAQYHDKPLQENLQCCTDALKWWWRRWRNMDVRLPSPDDGENAHVPRLAVEGLVSIAEFAGRTLVGSAMVAHRPYLEDMVEGRGTLVDTCWVVENLGL